MPRRKEGKGRDQGFATNWWAGLARRRIQEACLPGSQECAKRKIIS